MQVVSEPVQGAQDIHPSVLQPIDFPCDPLLVLLRIVHGVQLEEARFRNHRLGLPIVHFIVFFVERCLDFLVSGSGTECSPGRFFLYLVKLGIRNLAASQLLLDFVATPLAQDLAFQTLQRAFASSRLTVLLRPIHLLADAFVHFRYHSIGFGRVVFEPDLVLFVYFKVEHHRLRAERLHLVANLGPFSFATLKCLDLATHFTQLGFGLLRHLLFTLKT